MSTLFGCIADDFTGATDLAGLLARSGVRVSLRIGVPETLPEETAPFEVIALKIRTAPVADAVAESLSALRWLQEAGAQQFFWKYCSTFDSTAKGNIGPVAEALMTKLGARQTIYCPAFPENGRSIFMGNLFVGRELLSESPMQNHPLTPMHDSNLMRLLEPQVTLPVGLADRHCVAKGVEALRGELAHFADQEVAHVVVDAVANEDLVTISAACNDFPLMTGGSAITMPIPQMYMDNGLLTLEESRANIPTIDADTIVLSGSCSAMTLAQVKRYASSRPSYQLDPTELAESGCSHVITWLAEQSLDNAPLIYASAEPDAVKSSQELLGLERAGEIVEDAMAELALAARVQGARRFIVAGGETSGAVTKALGVSQLDIGPEIAPGVPWTFSHSGGNAIALTLKSGNFGAENFFADAIKKLDDA